MGYDLNQTCPRAFFWIWQQEGFLGRREVPDLYMLEWISGYCSQSLMHFFSSDAEVMKKFLLTSDMQGFIHIAPEELQKKE